MNTGAMSECVCHNALACIVESQSWAWPIDCDQPSGPRERDIGSPQIFAAETDIGGNRITRHRNMLKRFPVRRDDRDAAVDDGSNTDVSGTINRE